VFVLLSLLLLGALGLGLTAHARRRRLAAADSHESQSG
jgi:hypothetical protein